MSDAMRLIVDDEPPPEERNGDEFDPPQSRWRIVLTLAIAVALPLELAWFARRSDPWADARREVAALSEADRAELAADWERFRQLEPDEQRRLSELHGAIEADADPGALRHALAEYERWKSLLSPLQSAQLVGLDPAERIARLAALAAEQKETALRALSPADAKAMMAWLESQVDAQQDKLLAALPAQARQRLELLGRRERNVALILAVLNFRGAAAPRFEYLTPESLADLKSRLSPGAQQVWDAAGGVDQRRQLLVDWIRQAATTTYGNREGGLFAQRVDEAELMRFFESELSEVERNRFVALPREEMLMQLKREYLRRRGLWRESVGEPPQKVRPPAGKSATPPFEKRPGLPPGEKSPPLRTTNL